MAVPRQRLGELIQGVLKVLKDKPEGLRAREAVEALSKVLPPTKIERRPYPSNPGVERYDQMVPGSGRGVRYRSDVR